MIKRALGGAKTKVGSFNTDFLNCPGVWRTKGVFQVVSLFSLSQTHTHTHPTTTTTPSPRATRSRWQAPRTLPPWSSWKRKQSCQDVSWLSPGETQSGEKSRGVSALKLSTVSSLAGFKTHFSLPSASVLKSQDPVLCISTPVLSAEKLTVSFERSKNTNFVTSSFSLSCNYVHLSTQYKSESRQVMQWYGCLIYKWCPSKKTLMLGHLMAGSEIKG